MSSLLEACKAGHDGALVAGVQPFGAQLQLGLGPARAKGAHGIPVHALSGLPDRIDIPGQLGRIGPASGAGYRRVHQHQPGQAGRPGAGGADADARAHRVAHYRIARQAQGGGEGGQVGGLGIQAVVERLAASDRPRPRTSRI